MGEVGWPCTPHHAFIQVGSKLVSRIEANNMVADPIALLNVARSVPFRLGRAAWRISLPRHVQLLDLKLGVPLGVQQKEGGCQKAPGVL